MNLAIDATYLGKSFDGGKDQVLINLLKGFEKLNLSKNITIFCFDNNLNNIKSITPNSKIISFEKKFSKDFFSILYFKTFKLQKLINKNKIDILFFPSYNTGLKRYSIPTVVIPHDIQSKVLKKNFSIKARLKYNLIYYFDFLLRDKIIAISAYDEEQLKKYYKKRVKKIYRIYNPVCMLQNSNTNVLKAPIISAINIDYDHKNIITLIKAFDLLKDKIPHNLYLIGSNKNLIDYYTNEINKRSLSKRIILTGYVTNGELYTYLNQSDLYVNPSLFEGFGMTAIEAMILKTPTIVNKDTASQEITKGLCNYYSPSTSALELSKVMYEVISNSDSDSHLERIKNIIYTEYNYLKISNNYYNLFTKMHKDN